MVHCDKWMISVIRIFKRCLVDLDCTGFHNGIAVAKTNDVPLCTALMQANLVEITTYVGISMLFSI